MTGESINGDLAVKGTLVSCNKTTENLHVILMFAEDGQTHVFSLMQWCRETQFGLRLFKNIVG